MSTVVVINSLPSRAGAWRGILVIPVFEKEKQEGVLKSMFSLGYTLRPYLKTKQTPKTQFSKNTASVFTTDWDDFHVQPIWPFKHSRMLVLCYMTGGTTLNLQPEFLVLMISV